MARKVGNATTRSFRAGEVIFREGDDPRDEAFMIHAGRVEVHKRVGREQRLLRVLLRGELLGELGHLVRTNPALAVAIIRDLSTKLLATNQLLAAEGQRRQASS